MTGLRCAVIYPPLFEPAQQLRPPDLDAEIRCVPYEITDDVRQARRRDPATQAADEPEVTSELADALAWADALLCLDAPCALRDHGPSIRWVQALGSGVEQFRVSLDGRTGITLTNGAGLGSGAIAEWVVGRVLEHYKRFADHRRLQEQRSWERCFGRQLVGQRALIVGTGAIGAAVAARLAPFGVTMRGVRADPSKGTGHPAISEVIAPADLHAGLQWADIVVLAASSNQEGPMLAEREFAAMKPGSFFVNVARGSMVDEGTLTSALTNGHLAGAALDVVSTEPLPASSALWDIPNLVISPHSSVSQDGYFHSGATLFWDNARRLLAGEPLANVVDVSDW